MTERFVHLNTDVLNERDMDINLRESSDSGFANQA